MREDVPVSENGWSARRVMLATLVVVGVLLSFLFVFRFYRVVFIFFVAIVLSTAIKPGVVWLHRRGLPRALGVILVYIGLLLLLAGFLGLVLPVLLDQFTTLAAVVPDAYRTVRDAMTDSGSRFLARVAQQLPAGPALEATEAAPGDAPQSLSDVASFFRYVSLFGVSVFSVVAVLVLAFYWTLDGERTLRVLFLRVPASQRESLRNSVTVAETKVGAYLRGLTILSAVVGAMATAAYVLLGLPYALVLGVTAGVMEAVPVIGPILGAVPALVIAVSLAPSKVLGVIVATVIIQQLEGIFLVPRVMDKAVGVNPIVTLLALLAFGSLFGIAGALLAIPLAAVLQLVLDRFVLGEEAMDVQEPGGRDSLSTMRYGVQELIQDIRKRVRQKEDATDADTDRLEDVIEGIAVDLDSLLSQTGKQEAGS